MLKKIFNGYAEFLYNRIISHWRNKDFIAGAVDFVHIIICEILLLQWLFMYGEDITGYSITGYYGYGMASFVMAAIGILLYFFYMVTALYLDKRIETAKKEDIKGHQNTHAFEKLFQRYSGFLFNKYVAHSDNQRRTAGKLMWLHFALCLVFYFLVIVLPVPFDFVSGLLFIVWLVACFVIFSMVFANEYDILGKILTRPDSTS